MNYYYLGMLRNSAIIALLITAIVSVFSFFYHNVDVLLFYVVMLLVWFNSFHEKLFKYKNIIDGALICITLIISVFIIISMFSHIMLFINSTLVIFALFFSFSFIENGIKY